MHYTLRDQDDGTGDDIFCRGEHTTGRITVQQHRDDVGFLYPEGIYNDSSETGTTCILQLEYEYIAIYPAEED